MTPPSKRAIGRYRLVTPLGNGAQSHVWVAFDPTLGRSVALKMLDAGSEPAAIDAFEREARLMSQLTSPHVVRTFDSGCADGMHYLAMEHLVGSDLAQLVKQFGAQPAARVIHFGIGACLALEEAHEKGFVHRDVKPGNLFAARIDGKHDVPKLLDFGIARTLGEVGAVKVGGTPAYLAPECCKGLPASPASDIYSLGASLYHLATGSPPFAGDTPEIIAKHRDEGATRPSVRLGAALPSDLEDVLLACLAKETQERPPCARDLRALLEACEQASVWTETDSARFWDEDHRRALSRWTDETHT
ncbi:MAG: serine/threonine protein kinase [Deltaproteobacteria bacterium]|nr:serine/threonine protein kinase [Deltaproteobacteria bacterium]